MTPATFFIIGVVTLTLAYFFWALAELDTDELPSSIVAAIVTEFTKTAVRVIAMLGIACMGIGGLWALCDAVESIISGH
jgi:hypothetical protein